MEEARSSSAPAGATPLARRLHSLFGVVPLGAFLVFHLATNAMALRGADAYNAMARRLQGLPLMVLVEILVIAVPLGFHAIYGLFRIASDTPAMDRSRARRALTLIQQATGVALFASMVSSFIGSVIGIAVLIWLSGWLSGVATRFGAADYAAMMVLGLVAASTIGSKQPAKAFAMVVLGLILGILLISQFWTLANDVYDPRQAKRLFGFIGGGASLGGATGAAITALIVTQVGTNNLLLVSAAVLAACALLVIWIVQREREAAAASGAVRRSSTRCSGSSPRRRASSGRTTSFRWRARSRSSSPSRPSGACGRSTSSTSCSRASSTDRWKVSSRATRPCAAIACSPRTSSTGS